MKRPLGYLAVGLAMTFTLAACGGGSGGDTGGGGGSGGDTGGGDAAFPVGPITIWYSNNEQEVAWGEQVVAAWNTENPDETVTAQELSLIHISEPTRPY